MEPQPGAAHDELDEVFPLSRHDILEVGRRPHRLVDLLFAERPRLAASLAQQHRLPSLCLALLLASIAFSLPFGAVLGLARTGRVALVLVGSLLICFPSLHIFGAYLGWRSSIGQTLCLSLSMTAVAALFTFGFFPIIWFLDLTMSGATLITARGMAGFLLVCSIFAGMVYVLRLVSGEAALRRLGRLRPLLLPWLLLFGFITARMASFLDVP